MPAPDPLPLQEALEAIVRGSHLSLLDREVDPTWLAAFANELRNRLKARNLAEVAGDFMRIILNSEEAKNRLGLAGGAGAPLHAVMQPAIGARPAALSVIGLGCLPVAAGMLRRGGLRRWAGPFDWMTIPAEAVRDCLVDDFAMLMAPHEHQEIPADERPPGAQGNLSRHVRFSQLYGPTIFHLHDPLTGPGYAALERAVLRLRDSLRGLHGKLLIQVVEEEENTASVFAETAEFLDRTARGATLVTIALVEGRPEGPFPEMEMGMALGPHRLLRCRPLSLIQGIAFRDVLDDVVILRGALAAPQQK
jgi:hypothetical protein